MTLTHRETHVLILFVALMLGIGILVTTLQINMLTFNAWVSAYEPHILLAVGLPLGFYLVTDPARVNKKAPEGAEDN